MKKIHTEQPFLRELSIDEASAERLRQLSWLAALLITALLSGGIGYFVGTVVGYADGEATGMRIQQLIDQRR